MGRVEKIKEVLSELAPMIQDHGGDIEFVALDDAGKISLRLHGACIGCPMSLYTVKLGIEERLKEQVPGIVEVVIV